MKRYSRSSSHTWLGLIAVGLIGSMLAFAGDKPEDANKESRHIYLLIGQSNMAGRAPITEQESQPIDHVLLLNGEDRWEPAKPPMNRYSSIQRNITMQKLSPGFGFAKAMREANKDATICLVVNARGNTNIESWAKGQKYYNEAIRRTLIAKKTGVLKGILWHQGEANLAHPEGYLEKLKTLVEDLRKDLDAPGLPFVAGQIHDGPAINEQIARLHEIVPMTGYVSSEGLKTMDRWHFDTPGMKELGKRYAEQILKLQAAVNKSSH